MTPSSLERATIDRLLERFVSICVAQDQALLRDDYAKFNRLYKQMDEIDNELRARGSEARRALSRLFDHPHIQVRLKAATRSLGVLPAEARAVLEEIAASQEYPQAGDAGMVIRGLDDGSFKPT
jgi:hypothetical protein